MNGTIVELPCNPLPGFVLGSDHNRYPFDDCDVYSSPTIGDRVHFIRDGVTAANISKLEYDFDREYETLCADIAHLQLKIEGLLRLYS